MADAAALKREARRRQILENSESRLKRITGIYSKDDVTGGSAETLKGSIILKKSSPISPPVSDGAVKEAENICSVKSYVESPPHTEKDSAVDKTSWEHESNHIGSPPISSEIFSVLEPKSCLIYNLCQKARIHIIALAVLVRVLLTFRFAVLFGESAVVPLLTMELAEWIYTKINSTESQDSSSGLFGMAMMLSGISPKKVAHLLRIFNIFNHLTQDLCIYFFVFSIIHVLFQIFSYSEIN